MFQGYFNLYPVSVTLASLLLVGLLSAESPENDLSTLIILPDFYCRNMFSLALRFRKSSFQIFFTRSSIYMFYLATTPSAYILCLLIFQSCCQSLTKNSPQWLQMLLTALPNDVHQNTGPPFHNQFFTFMSRNVNSIAKDNFQRVV